MENRVKNQLNESVNKWMAKNRSLVLRQTPIWAQGLVGVMITLGTLSIAAGIFFRIDEVVTVSGQLVALTGSVDVKTPAGGKVAATYFKDGEMVKHGQLLVQFDTREAKADKETTIRMIELEKKDLNNKLGIFEGPINVLKQTIKTSEEITSSLKNLVEDGGMQKIEYLKKVDALFEQRNQLANVSLERNRTKLEAEKSIGQLKNRLQKANLQLQYQNIKAPIGGIVFKPIAAVDGVIGAGEIMLTIIPQKGLKAEVFISNADIGFVKTGLKAKVRVDAFPFARYGEIDGVVTQIGADALPPDETSNMYRFPVKISLDKNYLESRGKKIPLISGMAVTANLKLRDKRVISLISDMMVDQTESIKGIRQQ